MRPIVYLYQEQINALLNSDELAGVASVTGVAFEWRGEGVFHAFTDHPHVPPSGYPIRALFLSLKPDEDISRIDVAACLPSSKIVDARILVVAFSCDGHGVLQKRALLFDADSSTECDVHHVPPKSELYSRNTGLLELNVLERKRVCIIGLGSFGSTIAVELAKAGVGVFDLIDFDRIELSNIARHVCGVNDLGRYKTFAVRDQILIKNPFAIVATGEIDISERRDYLEGAIARSDLVICVTDSNASRFQVNSAALSLRKTALFARAITRAAGGDVFRVRPGTDGPCLSCIFPTVSALGEQEVSNFRQARKSAQAYMTESDIAATVQVGLASDIAPITNMVVKLALVELSRGTPSGISSLDEDLTADFYIWANRRDLVYASWPKMEYTSNKNSILRWYGARSKKDPECLECGCAGT